MLNAAETPVDAQARPRQRFQAAVRTGGTRRVYGHFSTREERDAVVRQARSGAVEPMSESIDTEDVDDPLLLGIGPTRECAPERRLCAALVLNAWEDLRGRVPRRAQDARAWIESRDTAPYGFEFCCDVIDMDVATAREKLLTGGWEGGPSRQMSVVRRRLRALAA